MRFAQKIIGGEYLPPDSDADSGWVVEMGRQSSFAPQPQPSQPPSLSIGGAAGRERQNARVQSWLARAAWAAANRATGTRNGEQLT